MKGPIDTINKILIDTAVKYREYLLSQPFSAEASKTIDQIDYALDRAGQGESFVEVLRELQC